MPDYIVLRDVPPVITAANPKAAIAQALAGMAEYDDADGSYTVQFWVGVPNGQLVDATVTVNTTRSLAVEIVP
jgi:hypothetical protein